MKKPFVFSALFLSVLAYADDNYVIKLDWNDKKTLQDNVVQVCDDTSYNAVEIIIPGKSRKDFDIEMNADIGSGKPALGCSISRRVADTATVFIFNASSNCEVRVYKRHVRGEEPKSAVYTISDAC